MGPQIFINSNYNFVGKRHLFIGISLTLLVLSILAIWTYGFNYSVEFTGGAQLEVNFNESGTTPKEPPTIDAVRASLEAAGIHQPNVVTVGADSDHDFLIRVQQLGGESLGAEIQGALVKKFGADKITYYAFDKETRDDAKVAIDDAALTPEALRTALESSDALKGIRIDDVRKDKATGGYTIVLANAAHDVLTAIDGKFGHATYEASSESIGAAVSKDLRRNAFLSIAGACVLIALYIWLRFDIDFAPGVVIALIHDAGITLGVWAIFGKVLHDQFPSWQWTNLFEFNLTFIAAILAIIGYSVTDTVVVYDRIRENLEKHQSLDLYTNINKAVNETLSRTMLTSLSAMLSVVAIAVFGSESIRGFGVAMAVGIIVGTYSSIYIAAPVTVFVHEFREKQKNMGSGGNKRVETGAKQPARQS